MDSGVINLACRCCSYAEINQSSIETRNQIQLERLNERILPCAEKFIQDSFTSTSDDQKELKTVFNEMIKDSDRKKIW